MTPYRFRSTELLPAARGREFGRAHAGQIRASIAAYQRLFDRAAGAPVDMDFWGEAAIGQIRAISPALLEEITGMAEGAGVPLTSLASINARTEILAITGGTAAKECSTLVHLPAEGPPGAVQAWDWYPDLADLWLVWEIPHIDGRLTTTVTEFGILGKIGVNSDRLGILFNILHHDKDGQTLGAPVHVLARAVLDEARNLNQALIRLATAPVSASSSLTLVAESEGESAAVSVELNPGGVGYALPDRDGLLIHTNHFLSSPASSHDTELRNGPDSVLRLDGIRRRARRLSAKAAAARITAEDLVAVLDSHLLGGGATCCHVDPLLQAETSFATLATVSLNVQNGTITAHAGGPCTYPTSTTTTLKENAVLNLKRIDNMDILTHDVGRLTDFYHGTLGLDFHLPYEPAEEWAAINMGNVTLYIFKSNNGEHAPRRTAVNEDNAPGFDSIAFEVDNLDDAEAHLDGKVEWVDQRIEWKHPNGTWYRYRPFFDPDGNMLYITEPHIMEVVQ
ncbi:C45 family autoproteolytic acyltransferase/hydrolase [Pseudarthrobacter sp. R1]|uniref:C45 family autoproteolytic acyltransferase/hydolase n=1 Tax=Pseudarthrobacter sp. R1 TaxID=2944934 RepID=UPI00210A36CC|nr:C45 family autoproteolytic acyltransferase/hydolase [Pseudarthrobacter sp. R1]MCQ6273343.1 C45 family autoproteolytic acyltransferase/hydrolase [Pseudarthrobacter sp. R1]